jgi:hypothetical protein
MPETVSTAFGSLVAPEVPQGTDLVSPLMSGMQLAAHISARKQELQNQVASLSLRARQDAIENRLNQQRYELAVKAQKDSAAHANDMLGVASANAETLKTYREQMAQAAKDRAAALGKRIDNTATLRGTQQWAANQLAEVDTEVLADPTLVPGSPNYAAVRMQKAVDRGAAGYAAPNVWNAWVKAGAINANAGQAQIREAAAEARKNLEFQIQSSLTQSASTDISPLLQDVEKLPDTEEATERQWYQSPFFGIPYYRTKTKPKMAGPNDPYKKVMVWDKDGLKQVPRDVPLSTLKELQKQLGAYQDLTKKVAPYQYRPDLGVHGPPGETKEDIAREALNSPNTSPRQKAGARRWLRLNPDGTEDWKARPGTTP